MPELSSEDQQKVDAFITSNVNDVERAPFRPWRLLAMIMVTLVVLTLISYVVARSHGLV